jgi:hypothetical protein
MWPFKKKTLLPGINKGPDGQVSYELSPEEKEYLAKYLGPSPPTEDELKYWHSPVGTVAPEQMMARMADALWHYAGEQAVRARSSTSESKIEEYLRKASAALMKAEQVFPLPAFTFTLASFSDMTGRKEVAKKLFAEFLRQQRSFEPSPLARDMAERILDTTEAVKFAESKLR